MADQGERADKDSFLYPLGGRAAFLSMLGAFQWSCPTGVPQNGSRHLQVSISSVPWLPARASWCPLLCLPWCMPWVSFCVRRGKRLRSPA